MLKKDILTNIETLFYNKSFSNVSMSEIATSLDIKKASLYYYFPSKEVLVSELLEFSFQEYKFFLLDILEKSLEVFIQDFIQYPKKSKNVFSVIAQNGYSEYKDTIEIIQQKQREIFDIICDSLQKKYAMSKERSFVLLCLLEEIGRKKCLNGECPIDMETLIKEIQTIITI